MHAIYTCIKRTFDIVRTTADCLQEGRIQHDLNPYKNGCAAGMKPLSPRISAAAKSQAFHEQCASNLVNLAEFAVDGRFCFFVRRSRALESKYGCGEMSKLIKQSVMITRDEESAGVTLKLRQEH